MGNDVPEIESLVSKVMARGVEEMESCDKRVNEILCGLTDGIQAYKKETG